MRLGLRSVDRARLTKYFPFVLKPKDKVNLEPGSPDRASVAGLSPRASGPFRIEPGAFRNLSVSCVGFVPFPSPRKEPQPFLGEDT